MLLTVDIGNTNISFRVFDGDKIILKKHRKTCFFCNAVAGGVKFKDYLVCHECIETLKAIKDENGIDE